MASRYWVGGTAAWDGTAGSKWATTSGGAGGAAVPTNADDVFLDANSGAVTVTVQTAVAVGGSVNCTGFTGTLVQSTNMNIGSATAGDFILSTGMTFTFSAGAIKLTSTKVAGNNIDLAGRTVGNFTINGNGSSFTLLSHIVATGAVAFSGGSVDLNGFNVTCNNLSNGNTLTRNTNMRGGTITMTGVGAIFDSPAGILTFSWTAGAKFIISNTSASAKTFAGGTNITYPTIQVAGAASAGTVTFSGAFTCNAFKFDPDCNVVFTISTTYTASSLDWNGTSGHNVSVKSTAAGTPFTLAVAAGATVTYCTIKDCTASGGTPFNAGRTSTDVSGNTNWSFTSAYTQGCDETATITDVLTRQMTKPLAETATMSDTLIRSTTKVLSETLTITDTLDALHLFVITFNESIAITDTLMRSISRILSETVTVTDTLIRSVVKLLAETLSMTDTLSRQIVLIFNETATMSDTLLKSISRTLSENVTVTDVLTRSITKLLAETVTMSATLIRTVSRLFSETLTMTDVLTRSISRTLSEVVTVTDTLTRTVAKLMSETVTVTATLSRQIQRLFSETLSMTDSVIRTLGKVYVESVLMIDTVSVGVLFKREFEEVIAFTDSLFVWIVPKLKQIILSSMYPVSAILRAGKTAFTLALSNFSTVLKAPEKPVLLSEESDKDTDIKLSL